MTFDRKIPRFAHTSGHTGLCFSEDGRYLITCGSEGDVRIWNSFEDDDPVEKCVGEKAYAVAQKGSKLYIGTDYNVTILTFPDGELCGILTRFAAPVTTVSVSKDGSLVSAGSCDMDIHVVETETHKVKYFRGHKAPILSVVIDPKAEYIASSCCDGSVRVWSIAEEKVVHEWTDVTEKSNSFEKRTTLCGISWEPNSGRLLAIPYSTEIRLFQRSTWNRISALAPNNSPSKVLDLTCWSYCGRYLAATSSNGEIIVWNTLINKLVLSSESSDKHRICSISWNPTNEKGQIAYCDIDGQLNIIDNCYPVTVIQNSVANNTSLNKKMDENVEVISRNKDYNDDDDMDAISLDRIKSDIAQTYHLDADEIDAASKTGDGDDRSSVASSKSIPLALPRVEFQPAFQPNSMPVHLQRRFMVYNDVGYVKQTNVEDENTIDVDFHDASIHHSFRINNLLSHTMASLSSEALVLACERDNISPSKVTCTLFHSWDGNKEWNIELLENESAEVVAVGRNFIAVGTSLRLIRFFTLTGIQRDVMSLMGPIVTMNSDNNLLMVAYHSSLSGLQNEQSMCFVVYKVDARISVIHDPQVLPLSPRSTLKWIGLSDSLNPCCFDSNDLLQIYAHGIWKPIYHSWEAEGNSNHLFITGVNELKMNIRCVLCKGTFYPLLIPHPFITEVPWKVPLCEPQVEKSIMEQSLVQSSIRSSCSMESKSSDDLAIIPTALKLFAIFCRSGFDMRALELIELNDNLKLAEVAHKYCAKTENVNLADKIAEYISKKKAQLEEESQKPRCSSVSLLPINGLTSSGDSPRNDGGTEIYSQTSIVSSAPLFDTEDSVIVNAEKKKSLSEQSKKYGKRKLNPFKISQSNDPIQRVAQDCSSYDSQVSVKPAFATWFKQEKDKLKSEFPDLTPPQLTTFAAKKYVELYNNDTSYNNGQNDTLDADLEQNSSSKKQKFENSSVQDKNSKIQAKLKAFAFKKD